MLATNQQQGSKSLRTLHYFISKYVNLNLWMISKLRNVNLFLVRYMDKGLLKRQPKITKSKPSKPKKFTSFYQELGISATIRITLFDDDTLSYRADGKQSDLTVTLATVIMDRPEFNDLYDNAQKVIAYYLAENN